MAADDEGSTTILAAPLSTRSDAIIEAVFESKEDNYQPQRVFAEGGMGRILEARDHRLQRRVVLKVLQTDAPVLRERFLREALITAKLQHPAIVPIYDFGQWSHQAPIAEMGLNGGEPYYVMKLVEGQSLGALIAKAGDLEARLALLRHVTAAAEAMAYAHDHHVIHRDLKPENILVGPFGETVVIDWGLAKELPNEDGAGAQNGGEHGPRSALFKITGANKLSEEELLALSATILADGNGQSANGNEKLTVAGAVMGTPDYMAPEQAAGDEVDFRADVWALGAILYELLAGDTPYGGDTLTDKLKQILTGPPMALQQRVYGLPSDLVAIVSKAMAHMPAARYPSARELMDDLRRFETGQIVSAHQYTTRERAQRFIARNKVAFGVASFALLTVLVLGVFALSRVIAARDRADGEWARAERERATATQHADHLVLLQARAALKTDPNATLGWLATLSPEADEWAEVRLLASDARSRGLSTVLPNHKNAVRSLLFSPDGRWLISGSNDHSARLYATDGWHSRMLGGATDEVWGGAFSTDSKRFLLRTKDRKLLVWDTSATEGAPRVLAGHQTRLNAAVLSPDGKRIASWGQQRGLWVWDVEKGEGQLVYPTDRDDASMGATRDGSKLAWISQDGLLTVWDWQHEPGTLLGHHDRQIAQIAFSADGRFIVSGSSDGEIRVWSLAGGPGRRSQLYEKLRFIAPIPQSSDFITTSFDGKVDRFNPSTGAITHLAQDASVAFALALSDDGDKVVWCTADAVRLLELSTGRLMALRAFDKRVTAVSISPNGNWVAAASEDFSTRLWRTDTFDGQRVAHWPEVRAWAFTPDMRMAAGLDSSGQLWAGTLGEPPRRYDTGSFNGRVVALSADGKTLATGYEDGSIHAIERDGGTTRTLQGHAGEVEQLRFAPDGKRLISGGRDGQLLAWQPPFDKPQRLHAFSRQVTAVALSKDGRLLAAGSKAGELGLWIGTEHHALPSASQAVTALAFTPDGNTLLVGSEDASIRAIDTTTRNQRYKVSHQFPVGRIVAASSGQRFASLTQNIAGVEVWDVSSGERLMMDASSHRGAILNAAFSPDDTRLATAGADGHIQLWELSLKRSRPLLGHTAPVTQVRFADDGRSLLSAAGDGALRRWYEDLPRSEEGLRGWLAKAVANSGQSLPE